MLYTLRLRLGWACLALALSAGSAQAVTINAPNVTIASGEFDEVILTTGATNFTLTGGTIFGNFTALTGTDATISGGSLGGDLLVPAVDTNPAPDAVEAVVRLVGSGFMVTVNGVEIFDTVLTNDVCGASGCAITGTLSSGTPIAIQAYPLLGGQVHLVPEPSAALLLGAGLMGLAFVGRRQRRAPRR
jgi:hypothetical protein